MVERKSTIGITLLVVGSVALGVLGIWYFQHRPKAPYMPAVNTPTEQAEVEHLQRLVPLNTAEEAKTYAVDAIILETDYPHRSTKTPFYGCSLRYPVSTKVSADGDWLVHCAGNGQTVDVEIGHDGVAQGEPRVTIPL